MLMCCFSILC